MKTVPLPELPKLLGPPIRLQSDEIFIITEARVLTDKKQLKRVEKTTKREKLHTLEYKTNTVSNSFI